MLRAVLFDFDGLILETEFADFQSWQEIYRYYGADLALATWLPYIGVGHSSMKFDVYAHLEAQTGQTFNRDEIRVRRRARYAELIAEQFILPGVQERIEEALRLNLQLAVASSSSRAWVEGHLTRLGLLAYFPVLACGDEVQHTKPDPEVYLLALERSGVQPAEALALEDSPNGVLAAKRAGMRCIAVPNPLTGHFPFEMADARLSSLSELCLQDWLTFQPDKLR
ncbi:MAG TPA: HAD family hydrolase [Ktedonobacteraceae bacterium]|jgi:HAD superfamily hydrolase (TIGR01509 family)